MEALWLRNMLQDFGLLVPILHIYTVN
jgi:hypothetical protein